MRAAVGDVIDYVNLTPVAIRQGHFLADKLFNNKKLIVYGKNSSDETAEKKYSQLRTLGFSEIYLYTGGLFEWFWPCEVAFCYKLRFEITRDAPRRRSHRDARGCDISGRIKIKSGEPLQNSANFNENITVL